jgi:hypothetical protein
MLLPSLPQVFETAQMATFMLGLIVGGCFLLHLLFMVTLARMQAAPLFLHYRLLNLKMALWRTYYSHYIYGNISAIFSGSLIQYLFLSIITV